MRRRGILHPSQNWNVLPVDGAVTGFRFQGKIWLSIAISRQLLSSNKDFVFYALWWWLTNEMLSQILSMFAKSQQNALHIGQHPIGVSTVICVVSINLPALWPPQKNWQQCRNCQCRILSSDTRRKPVEPEPKAGLPISLLDATIFWSAFFEVNSQYSVQLTCSQSREKLI